MTLTEFMPLLSVVTTVKVTVCVVEVVVKLTEESLTVNELIDGDVVSLLVTVIALLLVAELPAASDTVAVSEILVVP